MIKGNLFEDYSFIIFSNHMNRKDDNDEMGTIVCPFTEAFYNLFKPLGITNYFWKAFPNGTTNTGWGLLMRPIDMARFGILFLNNGTWKGKQIVPKEWSHKSTQEHTKMGRLQYAYGYQWWRFLDNDPTVVELPINDIYFALGYGGQEIIVIPHLHMVVVSTAENYRKMEYFKNLLYDYIFPSVIE